MGTGWPPLTGSGPDVAAAVAPLLHQPVRPALGVPKTSGPSEAPGGWWVAAGLRPSSGPAAVGFRWPKLRKAQGTEDGGWGKVRAERKGTEPRDRVGPAPAGRRVPGPRPCQGGGEAGAIRAVARAGASGWAAPWQG